MAIKVFYSWQSDTPYKVNRNFIEDAIKKALKQLGQDAEVSAAIRDEPLVLDKDTANVPGTPHIADTIFEKIATCDIFVPDLTFVAQTEAGKKSQNPNVLIEYGWARAKVGEKRFVAVMNAAYGMPDRTNLPFDMMHLRFPITYDIKETSSDSERKEQKEALAKTLGEALGAIIKGGLLGTPKPEFTPMPAMTERPSSFVSHGAVVGYRHTGDTPFTNSELEELKWHDSPQLFLRVIPTKKSPPLDQLETFNLLRSNSLSPFGTAMDRPLLSQYSYDEFFRSDGALTAERCGMNGPFRITYISNSGEIWGIDGRTLWKKDVVPSHFEEYFLIRLPEYCQFALDKLKQKYPLRVQFGFSGMNKFKLYPSSSATSRNYGLCLENNLIYEAAVTGAGTDFAALLKPAFEQIWKAFRLTRPQSGAEI